MNRIRYGIFLAVGGLAIVLAALYFVFGFPAKEASQTRSKDTKQDAKKSAAALKVAKETCRIAPSTVVVLAPKRVSQKLQTLPNCPTPLWDDTASQDMSDDEAEKRRAMVRHVEFKDDISFEGSRAFVDDLRRYRIGAIVMTPEGIQNRRAKRILRQAGYQKVEMFEKNHIWIQNESWREVDQRDRQEAEQLCRHVPQGSYVLAPFSVSRQLKKLGCCSLFLDDPPETFANTRFEERRGLLEGVLMVDDDFLSAEAAILREVLETRLIRAVVLMQRGDGNKKLKDELRRYGFKMATKSEHYRLWIPKRETANRANP